MIHKKVSCYIQIMRIFFPNTNSAYNSSRKSRCDYGPSTWFLMSDQRPRRFSLWLSTFAIETESPSNLIARCFLPALLHEHYELHWFVTRRFVKRALYKCVNAEECSVSCALHTRRVKFNRLRYAQLRQRV